MRKPFLEGRKLRKKWTTRDVSEFRRMYDLTQVELALLLGCRQQTVSDWELELYQPSWPYSKILDDTKDEISHVFREECSANLGKFKVILAKYVKKAQAALDERE